MRYCKLKIGIFIFTVAHVFGERFSQNLIKSYFTHKSHKLVDNKSKTSLFSDIQQNILLMKINNILLMLHTRIILLSSFMMHFFLEKSFRKFSCYINERIGVLLHYRRLILSLGNVS